MTGQTKRVKQYNRYPDELKRKTAMEYLSGAASYAVLAEEHGLRDKDVSTEFVKWYRRKFKLGGENEPSVPEKSSPSPRATSSRSSNKSSNFKSGLHCRS